MTDYYAILRPAILALEPSKRQSRTAIYDRARKLIADRSVVHDGPLSEVDVFDELHALELAIRRIEAELSAPRTQENDIVASLEEALQPEDVGHAGQPRRMVFKLVAIGLIACLLTVTGWIGFRYWTEQSGEDSRFQKSPASPRALAEIRDGILRIDELPYTLRRQLVYYRTPHPPGTLVISKSQKFLYLVRPNVAALRYSIGIGRKCVDSAGLYRVSQKEIWSDWKNATSRGEGFTRSAVQTENPLGAGALHLEDETHRIHGISKAVGFGSALGCFQLINDDIADLVDRVPLGTRVVATN